MIRVKYFHGQCKNLLGPWKYLTRIMAVIYSAVATYVLREAETCNGRGGRAGFTGLRVPEQILKLFECQSVLLKILRLYVKNNPVKLIPY
jgi:hypothetical protein